MNDRMDHAFELAAKCWGKAIRTEPSFVAQYLELAEQLLMSKPLILGDEVRAYCGKYGLFRPATLHHNVWVSGVNTLRHVGWIEAHGKTTPTKSHNHMPTVTVWKSKIFDSTASSFSKQKSLDWGAAP